MQKKKLNIIFNYFAIVLLLFASHQFFAQSKTDKLLDKLESANESEKPNLFNQLSETNSENASDKAIQYAETALKISRKNITPIPS